MGVPMAGHHSTKLPFPPFTIQFLLFLSYLQRAVNRALLAVGLGVLLGDTFNVPASSFPAPAHHYRRPAQHISVSTMIRQALPSSPYKPPSRNRGCQDSDHIFAPDGCVVCLNGLEAGEEVRRLGGCHHVFHTFCIDPWIDIGRRTCPLCRAHLAPQEMLRQALDAAGKISDEDTVNIMSGSSTLHSSYYDNADPLS